LTIYVITPHDILVWNIAYWSVSRVPRSRSYLFGGIMWHNGNSKWEPICVSRYKQCHFRTGHGLYLSPMQIIIACYTNEEERPPVLLPDPQNCTRNLPVGQISLSFRPHTPVCTYADVANAICDNINETDALASFSRNF